MCRCCQNCWEDLYWNCFEERFCYDESIANYNPEDDEEYLSSQKNGVSIIGRMQPSTMDNNNLLTVPQPICDQPLGRGNSGLGLMSAKIHEEDYRRETQTNVPMLGPEIIAVFANSQIFQDHQPTKLNRINTKTHLTGVHSPNKDMPTTPRLSEQDRLLRRLEGAQVTTDATDNGESKTNAATPAKAEPRDADGTSERRIKFTLSPESSPEGSQILTPQKFEAIAEEEAHQPEHEHQAEKTLEMVAASVVKDEVVEEVILRPRLFDRHPHLLPSSGGGVLASSSFLVAPNVHTPKRTLRSAKSVPHFNVRPATSETDIFAITGTGSQISMTPEVPSISFSNLPKNYEDTPTIEKYRVSQSLYSIQTANAARATQDDYSMPRYFRRSAMMMMTQSTEMLAGSSSFASVSGVSSTSSELRRPEKEKSKRMQMLRGNLPPLLIHSVSFKRNRDEAKQVD